MAFSQVEPFGSHYDDLRAGVIASMLANVNRNTKVRREPFDALDFIPWNDHHRDAETAEPLLLDDPEAHSAMIDRMLFPRRNG
ncbi:phage tail assembly protein T [Paraburkholderia tuberum]|uniref:phage tail assembly protein T n=1 Tax=Paraburkholderia tuberum TaxID=157910 RepID=UPI003CC56247